MEAPRCGVSSVFGAPSSGESGRRLLVEDVDAGPGEVTRFERLCHRGLVDDAAAGHVEHDRAGLELGDRRPADQALRRAGQRHVHGDDVRACEQGVEVDELGAVIGRLLGRDVRVDAQDDHLHGPCSVGDGQADLAQADDPERPAAQLEPGELRALPLAATDRGIGGGRSASDAVKQGERVLGRGDGVARRRVDDRDPGAGRGVEVDVVHADAGATDDDQPRAGGDELGIHLDLAAHDQRVIVGEESGQLLARAAEPLVDLVGRREELHALARDLLGDEDPHPPAPAAVPVTIPYDSSAATCAAATAAPGLTVRPLASAAISSVLERPQDLLERDGSEVAQPEDLARQLALTAGEDHATPLDLGVERLPVEVVGDVRGRHGARRVALVGEQLEAEGDEPGASGRGTRLVAREDVLGALLGHQAQPLVDLVDDGDRRRERRLPVRGRVAMRPQIEIEARHPSRFHRRPTARRGGDHGQARRGHPRLLRTGDDEVDAPVVHLERDGAEAGHAVDEDQGVGCLLADGGCQLRDGVHDPGRGLVVGQQDGLDLGHRAKPLADLVGCGRVAPLGIEPRDVRAVHRGDLGEPVAERADAHAEDPVARRQRVDDRGLQPARARRRDHRDVGGRAEVRLHPLEDAAEHRRELGASVVDHLASARLADRRRQGGGARDAEVGLETIHGTLLGWAGDDRPRAEGVARAEGLTGMVPRTAPSGSMAGFVLLADTCAERGVASRRRRASRTVPFPE